MTRSKFPPSENDSISAQVILKPYPGKNGIRSDITADNLDQFSPSQQDIDHAISYFKESGFETGHVAGISFSITAPRKLFERTFDIALAENFQPTDLTKLSISKLPVRDLVEAVVFGPSPDFGPTQFF